tara:strand:+ start:770 stop:1132 length:363 start_codon:yes stop_codon:yes gene_type:complete
MKNILFVLLIFLLFSCDVNRESEIDPDFLIGGKWCGETEVSGGEICIEFLNTKAYLTTKNAPFNNALDYLVLKRDGEARTITWEFVGEGTLNVFKIISKDSIEFKQKGSKNSAIFKRLKN